MTSRILLLSMLALACARAEIVGTPEYFAQMTGVRLELESPARVCRNWSSFPSEGASVFVWDLSAEQVQQLLTTLPGFRPSSFDSDEASVQPWRLSAPPHSVIAAAVEAQGGACEGAAIDPAPADLLGALAVSPSTLAASTGDARNGAIFAFGPERRVLIEVSYSW